MLMASPSIQPRTHESTHLHKAPKQAVKSGVDGENAELRRFSALLKQHGIQVLDTREEPLPADAQLHDRRAPIPALVVSPENEQDVVQTLKIFKESNLYNKIALSVKSGGHGYFNGASCTGVMLNLSRMDRRQIKGSILSLEPGCLLGATIDILAKVRKAVPHGDCFGVGAGGHFLTAGWDILLARQHGLGCQSVVGGRIALWDGTVLDVDEKNHPEILYAMRGGAAAGAGVVTKLHLQLIDEPHQATWRFTPIQKEQLMTCIAHKAFSKSLNLPREVSVSFRFHFEQHEPVCSFNITSLLTAEKTMKVLETHLGEEVARLVADRTQWNEKHLLDLRLIPASDRLKKDPTELAVVSQEKLHCNPLDYWTESSTKREMERSFFTSISYWVKPDCEDAFHRLYSAFEEVRHHPVHERMYALIVVGGGRMNDLQSQCAMPLGQALGRFELHWDDDEKEREWAEKFTQRISEVFQSVEDTLPGRPYRGDIWIQGQDADARLDTIRRAYDRRFS